MSSTNFAYRFGITDPADALDTVSSIFDFFAEILSRPDGADLTPISGQALEGLASLCLILRVYSAECARPNN